MTTSSVYMRFSKIFALLFISSALFACGTPQKDPGTIAPGTLGEIPSVRLNFRYEPDVPPPTVPAGPTAEFQAGVAADFQANRPTDILDRTIVSPDGKRVLAVYRQPTDVGNEFRLDMYSSEGSLLNKTTSEMMAVHFPDTITWAPDSSAVAFVAMIRAAYMSPSPSPGASPSPSPTEPKPEQTPGVVTDEEAAAEMPTPEPTPAEATPEMPLPTGLLAFRTEQIYLCNADGVELKALTQTEGLMYYYYVWSPDSTMLAAMAATSREWQYLTYKAELDKAVFIPNGRLRVIERSGRERRLDDTLTAVRPVWSPDSAKVALAIDTQIRIYDAVGNNPTQAAIPLQNQLLLSSQAYDRDQSAKLNAEDPAANAGEQTTTLPDPKTLVSYNPIVDLSWPSDELLYFHTSHVRRMLNEDESVNSFSRWHRLVLSPQASEIRPQQ